MNSTFVGFENLSVKIKYIISISAALILAALTLSLYIDLSTHTLTINDYGRSIKVTLHGETTIDEALAKAGVVLSPYDTLTSPLSTPISSVKDVTINRSALKNPPAVDTLVKYSFSSMQSAANVYAEARKREAEALRAQQQRENYVYSGQVGATAVIENGTLITASGSYGVVDVITMEASAYCPCSICCGEYASGYTADGSKATAGYTVATSSAYSFGTLFYIPFFDRVFEVEDRGGAIQGNRIDIYFDTHQEALNFGRHTITVYIIR